MDVRIYRGGVVNAAPILEGERRASERGDAHTARDRDYRFFRFSFGRLEIELNKPLKLESSGSGRRDRLTASLQNHNENAHMAHRQMQTLRYMMYDVADFPVLLRLHKESPGQHFTTQYAWCSGWYGWTVGWGWVGPSIMKLW